MWPPQGSCLLRVMATPHSLACLLCASRSSRPVRLSPGAPAHQPLAPSSAPDGSRSRVACSPPLRPPRHQLVKVQLPVLEPAEPTVRPVPLSRVWHSVIALCNPSEGTRQRTVSGLPGDAPHRIHQLREPHQFTTTSLLCQVGCVGSPFAPRLA